MKSRPSTRDTGVRGGADPEIVDTKLFNLSIED
jgi:hypothetical protein